jgi:hypothetical protein
MTRLASDRGTTLIETMIAMSLLLIVMAGLLSLVALATAYTENHGHLEARTTEYAQDKMEQLMALAYSDSLADTVVFPAAATGGTGLTIGGSADPAAPANGYVDWLDVEGTLLGGGSAAPASWFFMRVWAISCHTGPCTATTGVKQVTVTSTVKAAVGNAIIPRSSVVALKAAQF